MAGGDARRGRARLVRNAGQVVTMATGGRPKRGPALADPGVLTATGVIVRDGTIEAVGPEAELERALAGEDHDILDAEGGVVAPGFVDPHTHLVFAGSRPVEFEVRLTQGRSFTDIIKTGGGAMDTVRRTRATGDAELEALVRMRLERMATWGTTTAEVKSGYGLSIEEELRHLRILARVARSSASLVVPTALPAHFPPLDTPYDLAGYVDRICEDMIPVVATERLATSIDMFLDPTAYSSEQVRRMVGVAAAHGLGSRIHADQLHDDGGGALAAEIGAWSADHLGHINAEGIAAMSRSETVGVLIPGSLMFVPGEKAPPAREMIEAGVIVAVSTDYTPGTSPIAAMPLALSLAMVLFKMTAAEVLAAATINAAFALRVADRVGSLEVGKRADLVVYEAADYREIPYRFGENLVRTALIRGEVFVERSSVGPL